MSRANLAMYDLPSLRGANDAWWAGIARALRAEGVDDAPDSLDRETPLHDLWRAPDLLFSQTCGYPLMYGFKNHLRLLATPVYGTPEHEGPVYCSLFLVRGDDPGVKLDDFRGQRVAINEVGSQSGYSALRHAVAPLARNGRFFSEVVVSGGHRHSMTAVRDGQADICAVDSVTHRLVERAEPERCAGLRILARSAQAPALPYVTSKAAPEDRVERIRAALLAAAADPDLAEARADLLIEGIDVLPLEAYHRMVEMEAEAIVFGYPEIR